MADSPDDTLAGGDGVAQRRSGRVVRPPNKYLPEPTAAAPPKRKRTGDGSQGGDDDDDDEGGLELGNDDDDADDDDADDDGDDDDDDDAGPQRARPKRKANGASAKRAIKKPKLNGTGSHAASLPSRPKKSVRVALDTDGDHGSALYADIFSSGDDSGDVAARWYERYQTNSQAAVADLVNCILSAAGCDHHITEDDINDPDNCSNRLTELQGIYEDQKITDYPLIAKSRSTRSFRELLVQFFHALINVLHETEMLYTQPEIMENVVRWVASLSSSTLRPFRHTATTVALAMLAALVDVAKKLDDRINKMTMQVESQRGRGGGSRGKAKDARLAAFEASLGEAGGNRERAAELMKEFFDTVFVHRYRDVDPRIRTECVEALGSWVWTLPAVYMQPEYLRYLGWMLSDSHPATRQEVLKQLARVFRRDASKMGHFIDRFRARLIEMATKDADIAVRVTAIGVVEQLRPAGLLEPDEIDAIGQLIFDAELRIRRAAVHFFADCVREFASIKLDEVGGEEVLYELFGKGQSRTGGGDFDAPRRDWINVKSLANTISAYEAQLGSDRDGGGANGGLSTASPWAASSAGLDVTAETANAVVPETSRLALATQVLVDKIPEITNWAILAGYLLYDHSVETTGGGSKRGGRKQARTSDMAFRAAVAPADNEEAILLEILAAAAKASLAPGSGSGDNGMGGGGVGSGGGGGEGERGNRRRPAGGRGEGDGTGAASLSAAESSEAAALQLAGLIPRLLRKFGAEPATAVTVLRLQHALNLEVFRQLRQDTATFEGLLDEICAQFTRHADTGVVAEAAAALLHARQYEELEEAVDGRVSALWATTLNALRTFDRRCELSVRRNLSAALATELSVTLFKINKLAAISDCVDVLEAVPGSSHEADGAGESPAIELLVRTVHRGKFEEPDEELDNIEDGLTANAIGACQFYFMWKVRSLVLAVRSGTAISERTVDALAMPKREFDQNVVHTFSSRGYNDDLRLYATGVYCDLHVLFAQLRRHLSQPAVMARYVRLGRLVDHVPAGLIGELVSIFDAAERSFAKKTKKTLNDPADDEDPVDDPVDEDDEEDDEDDEDDEAGGHNDAASAEARRAAELRAERALCDLTSHYVMAIVAGVLDGTGAQAGRLKRRLLRNQNKLGHSYKEIVAFLDEAKAAELLLATSRKKGGSHARAKGKEAAAAAASAAAAAAAAVAVGAPTPAAAATPGAFADIAIPSSEHDHDHDDVLLGAPTPMPMGAPTPMPMGAPTPMAHFDDEELRDLDLLDTPEPEEGTLEDLRRRELIDAAPEDDEDMDDDDDDDDNNDDDDVLGD